MVKSEKKILKIQTKSGVYRVLIWWDKNDGAYLVKVPSLPGIVTFGKSLSEAKKMAKDAIELYCNCMIDEGKIIIDDGGRAIGRLPKSRILVLTPTP